MPHSRFRVARIFLKMTNFFQNVLPLNASAIVGNVGEDDVQHQVNSYRDFLPCLTLLVPISYLIATYSWLKKCSFNQMNILLQVLFLN